MAAVRPQLRGLLKSNLQKHVVACALLCFTTVGCFKVFVKDARMKKYEEFYKHYDAQKDFERMRDVGVFQSVKPVTK
jgi:cytochrome c oxidase subunit 6c